MSFTHFYSKRLREYLKEHFIKMRCALLEKNYDANVLERTLRKNFSKQGADRLIKCSKLKRAHWRCLFQDPRSSFTISHVDDSSRGWSSRAMPPYHFVRRIGCILWPPRRGRLGCPIPGGSKHKVRSAFPSSMRIRPRTESTDVETSAHSMRGPYNGGVTDAMDFHQR